MATSSHEYNRNLFLFPHMSNTDIISSLLKARQQSFDYGQFVGNVCNNKYVLVLGSEVLLDKSIHADVDGDMHKYILNRINGVLERENNPYPSLNAMVESRPLVSTGYDPSGADLIRAVLEQDKDDLIISPELVSLLETRLFRFVMTTSFDGMVETVMKQIWGEGRLRVVNIADQSDWKKFQMEVGETRDTTDCSRTTYQYDRPTLIYIFGKASDDRSSNFMKTENDAIRFIELWMNRNEPIIALMREKRMLALGCRFNDWYFRFFWYILKRDFGKLDAGEVVLSHTNGKPDDQALIAYLKDKNIFIDSDARQFMQNVCDMLNPEKHDQLSKDFYNIIKSKRGDGYIFLSYCSRDFILASRIFFNLIDQGYNVWFDNENLCGGDYEVEIRKAIHGASVVLTLLTPDVMEDLTKGETDHFYCKEWRLASETGCERIIPVAADGYSLRGNYHTKYESIIGGHLDGIDLMTDGFAQLKKMIDNVKTK